MNKMVTSIPQMREIFERCRGITPSAILIDKIINWWSYVSSGLHSKGYTLSEAHSFRFRFSSDNSVEIMYKIWPTDEKWLYPHAGGTAFVGSSSEGPIGYFPQLLIDTSALRKSITAEQKRLGSSFDWWDSYLNNLEVEMKKRCQKCIQFSEQYKFSYFDKR